MGGYRGYGARQHARAHGAYPRRQIAAAGPVRPRRLQGRAPGTAYLKSRYETRSAATTHTRTNTAAPAPRRVSSMGRRRIERRAPRPSEVATARQAHRSPRLKGTSAIQTRNTPEVNDRTAAVEIGRAHV